MHAVEHFRALAEALSPLSHSLAAGLLIRPVPEHVQDPDGEYIPPAFYVEAARTLCVDLDILLKEQVPLMQRAVASLEDCSLDELDDCVENLAAPALELIDMSRRIWQTALPLRAEAARPLLATVAEAPVTQLLQWVLEVMHIAIDPWAIANDPEQPAIGFFLDVPDGPVRAALALWRDKNPGVLPESILC